MTSLTWRLRAGLLPFRARVGSAAGLGLAGAGWGRAGGHVRLCRCPQGLRGPLWRSLDQPWAPGRAFGTAVGQSRPGREAAEGSSPVCSPPALDWPPPLTRWQLRCLVQTQPRSGLGGRPSPHPGRLEAPGSRGWLPDPSSEPHRNRRALEGGVFLNAHISFVSPLTFFLFHNSHTAVGPPRRLRPTHRASHGDVTSESESGGRW